MSFDKTTGTMVFNLEHKGCGCKAKVECSLTPTQVMSMFCRFDCGVSVSFDVHNFTVTDDKNPCLKSVVHYPYASATDDELAELTK